jgi:hypothetical protein
MYVCMYGCMYVCVYVCMELCKLRSRSSLLVYVAVLYAQFRLYLFPILEEYGHLITRITVIAHVTKAWASNAKHLARF